MTVFSDALTWLNDPLNWTGRNGVLPLTASHLQMALLATLIAVVLAVPAGVLLGRARRGAALPVVLANTSRAFPTLALLVLFALSPIGFGNRATVVAVAIFAVPPILTNTYVAIRGVDRYVLDAARGTGMSPVAVIFGVQLPLAVPTIAAGVRTAAVQVVATIPLAALVGGGGLGVIIVSGMANQRYGQALAGGVLVAALCLLLEGTTALAQRLLTPRVVQQRSVT